MPMFYEQITEKTYDFLEEIVKWKTQQLITD